MRFLTTFFTFALGVTAVSGVSAQAETHFGMHEGGGSVGRTWTLPSGLTFGGHLVTDDGDTLTALCGRADGSVRVGRSDACTLTGDGSDASVAEALALLDGQRLDAATVTAGYRMDFGEYEATLSAAVNWYHEAEHLEPGLELRVTRGAILGYASWHDLDLAGYTPLAGHSFHVAGDVVRVGIGFRLGGRPKPAPDPLAGVPSFEQLWAQPRDGLSDDELWLRYGESCSSRCKHECSGLNVASCALNCVHGHGCYPSCCGCKDGTPMCKSCGATCSSADVDTSCD